MAVLAAGGEDSLVAVCFIPFILLGLLVFVLAGYRYEVSEDEISRYFLGRTKRMRWDEIGRIRSRGLWGNLDLAHRDGTYSIHVDSQMAGYLHIVWLLWSKRPDLWTTGPSERFHAILWPRWILGGMGLFMAVWGIKAMWEGEVPAGLVLLAMGVMIFSVMVLRPVQTVTFEGDEMVLKSLLRSQRVQAASIKEIRIESGQSQGAMAYSVVVELKTNNKIALAGFRQGAPRLFFAMQAWLKENGTAM